MTLRRLRWMTAGAVFSATLLASTAGASHQNGFEHFNSGLAETGVECTDAVTGTRGCLYVRGWGNDEIAVEARGSIGVQGSSFATGSGAVGVSGRVSVSAPGIGSAGVKGATESTAANGNGPGVWGFHEGSTGTSPGVLGSTVSNTAGAAGVRGTAPISGTGVRGFGGNGGWFESAVSNGTGVLGTVTGAGHGVRGEAPSNGTGVRGLGGNGGWFSSVDPAGTGVLGTVTGAGHGMRGEAASNGTGVRGLGGNGGWFSSLATNGTGVLGTVTGAGHGVRGEAGTGGAGVVGTNAASSGSSYGVRGSTASSTNLAAGVFGEAPNGTQTAGVLGSSSGFGVLGSGAAAGVVGYNPAGLAGYFVGNVTVTGTLTKGAGAFRIDHPLEPKTKYLQHSFVESPDMKNVYDGVVRTDRRGYATVRLPRYFGALNRDFRYQLTLVGKAAWGAQAVVWEKIRGNRFVIRSKPRVEVSWQVTGIRKDAYANANRIQTEVAKTEVDRAALRPARLAARLRAK